MILPLFISIALKWLSRPQSKIASVYACFRKIGLWKCRK
jgi:hypothetical protein